MDDVVVAGAACAPPSGRRSRRRSSRFAPNASPAAKAIRVEWTDGPTEQHVHELTRPFEHIDRDDFGEILGGGNRYVSRDRQISPAAAQQAAATYGAGMGGEGRILAATTFDAQGRPQS